MLNCNVNNNKLIMEAVVIYNLLLIDSFLYFSVSANNRYFNLELIIFMRLSNEEYINDY